MRINLFRNLQWLLSNATNNINQIAESTNTIGVIYKEEIDYMRWKKKNYQKKYGRSILYFLINQKKVLVISMAITKIHPIKSTLNFHEKLKVYQSCVKLSKTPILEEWINIDK